MSLSDRFLIIYEGEIVGLAGLMGSGRTELANLIYGIETFSSGKITFKNKQYMGKQVVLPTGFYVTIENSGAK